jgi:protein-L-isoaspartate(D-aspartate) O-methyltransferase
MAPMAQARLIQLADVHADDLVLDVGCATGYSTAILARLAGAVIGLEVDEDLAARAVTTLTQLEADNADVAVGPLREGASAEGPYDVILLEGSVPGAPAELLAQLKQGGRLVAILRGNGLASAYLFEKIGSDISHRKAFDAGAPPLPDFEQPPAFIF